ncbi:hypothetical protein QYF61_008551 [Mycteria americana]|uniref:Uncharacterized protein n=1 Tax=Mycteria americana TaxID=33587 RepID=A0AAN7NTB5_MYCAM|nr:hypothetical protein QYF61_008551 [Mycteria americana]
MEKTTVEQVVPCSPWRTMTKQIPTLQPMEDATAEQVDIPEGTVAHRKPMPEQGKSESVWIPSGTVVTDGLDSGRCTGQQCVSVPMLDNPLGEEKFPNIQSKPPLAQLEAISSRPITCYLGEETDPHLSTTSFQVVVESDKVSPQPPFLQAKQSQFPQPLLRRLLLQTLHQLRCPSLDTVQHLNVPLVVGGPKLNTVFENLTLDTSNDGASITSLGNLFLFLTTLTVKNFFLTSNLNLPSFSLKQLTLVLSLQALAGQPQLAQPFFRGAVFLPSDHFCAPSLELLEQVHVFLVLGTPELDTVLQEGSHRVEGENHLPRPAGHTSFYAAQGTIGVLGCKRTLLSHVQVFIHQAALNPFIPQPVPELGIAPTQVQDLALGLVELHEVLTGPLLKPVKILLDGIPPSSISAAPLSLDTYLWFYCLRISFLHFSLTRRSLLNHASLLPSLPDHLHNLTLDTSNDGASITSLGNLFLFLTTLTVKNFFLTSNLNLPSFSLKQLTLVLSLRALSGSLLFPRLDNPNLLSLSSEERCSCPLIIFVPLLWNCLNREVRRGLIRTATLDFWRADFGLFRRLVDKVPWEAVLKGKGVQEGWIFYKKEILKAQDQAVPMYRKMTRQGRTMSWLNREL